jgi:hypothetical protein
MTGMGDRMTFDEEKQGWAFAGAEGLEPLQRRGHGAMQQGARYRAPSPTPRLTSPF